MGRHKMSDSRLRLLMKSPQQYAERFGVKLESAKRVRRKYKNQLEKELLLMEQEPNYQPTAEHIEEVERLRELLQDFKEAGIPVDESDAENVDRITFWTGHSIDKETGEPVQFINRYVRMKPTERLEDKADVYTPATPAEIRPTRRKRAQRIGRAALVFGDTQIGYRRVYDQDGNDSLLPTHDEDVLDIIRQINADIMPETIVNLSDTIDLSEFGRFDPDSDNYHRTIGPSFQRVHDMYAQLIADNPDGRYVEVDSNHTMRVHKRILKQMPELYGMTLPGEDYPLMSYYRLANLGALGIEFISGYGAAEFVYGEEYEQPPIVFKHGTHSSANPGATAKKEMAQNPTTHIVRGHGHSYEAVARTTREGRQLYYIQLGASCSIRGEVPSYHNAIDDFGHPVTGTGARENWQNQIMVIKDYENGQYQFDVIDIIDGVAHYDGKRYVSEFNPNV